MWPACSVNVGCHNNRDLCQLVAHLGETDPLLLVFRNDGDFHALRRTACHLPATGGVRLTLLPGAFAYPHREIRRLLFAAQKPYHFCRNPATKPCGFHRFR